jgi:hypothetical protein
MSISPIAARVTLAFGAEEIIAAKVIQHLVEHLGNDLLILFAFSDVSHKLLPNDGHSPNRFGSRWSSRHFPTPVGLGNVRH